MQQNRAPDRLIKQTELFKRRIGKGGIQMEQKNLAENLWRVWVDTRRRTVSFHEEEGCQLLEFRSRELFLSCVDQYTGLQYRYQ